MLGKIVRRAGLEMFSRLFDNMRITRSNEVYRKWGAFRESEWIGHSRRVREDHYLTITDDDFQEAAEWAVPATEVPHTPDQGRRKTATAVPQSLGNYSIEFLPAIFPAVRSGNERQGSERQETKKAGNP